ncbi:zinc-binding dehydrogenase [Streptomyces sp. NPDC008079]|uniref:zinc-binding dehydrogenase n=1 Tax=Streptomyces sp. NPDC008079 TaxID=3364806 RepID=UPI0036F06E4D
MSVPGTMRAVRIAGHGGPEVLEAVEVAVPAPGAGEVLVEVAAVALNNTDLWTREGAYGSPQDATALSGWRGPIDFPRIQGADVAGRVVAVGPREDVSADGGAGFEGGTGLDGSAVLDRDTARAVAGDTARAVAGKAVEAAARGAAAEPNPYAGLLGRRVVIDPAVYDSDRQDANPIGLMGSERDGGYAEYVTAPVGRVHDMTESPLTDDQLASLPTAYGTALGMIERGGLRDGETALVSGASGGVGLALTQLARARGAKVLAVSSGSKADAVRAAGAHVVIDRARDVAGQIRAAAPDGIDIGLDVVAGELVSACLPLLREGGRWVVAGALGGYGVTLDVRRLYLHNARVIGSSMHTPAHFGLLMDLAREGAVRPVVAATFPLVRAARAQEELARRGHVGKIVLHP